MMYNSDHLEKIYARFIEDLPQFLPEGTALVDIEFLERFDLLNQEASKDGNLTRYFHVSESQDKITLVNEQFIIWIIPEAKKTTSSTLVLIALNRSPEPRLELGFLAKNVYNSSKLILRILEKLLSEIQENEDSIKKLSPT